MALAMTSFAALVRPFTPNCARHRPAGQAPSRQLIIRAADPNSERTGGQDKKGVVPGLAQWPPKPITEHGAPKPEDDPANFAAEAGDVQGYKRVDGPSEDELKKKHEEGRKNSPFSNPSREGGTQAGGGGEGSGA